MGFNIVTVNVSQTIGAIPRIRSRCPLFSRLAPRLMSRESLYYSPVIRILTIW